MEETKVLKRLRRGETKALEEIIDAYSAYVQTVIRNIIGQTMTHEDMEEVASDVFFSLWNQADKVQPGKLKAYLSGIARNQALNKLRQRQHTVELEEDVLLLKESADRVETQILREEQAQIMKQALAHMEQSDKEIFLRHYYYYQTVELIAEQMDMKESTVKSRLKRGRVKLKQILKQQGYESDEIIE